MAEASSDKARPFVLAGCETWQQGCYLEGMILLVTPSRRAHECATAIEDATGQKTTIAGTLLQAITSLRAAEYDLVVLDQHLVEVEPYETETATAHIGTAVVLELNLALNGVDRVLRAVQSGLAGRQREEANARLTVAWELRGELNDALTHLLAECDLASTVPGIPQAVVEKLSFIRDQALQLCSRLAPEGHTTA